MFYLLFDTGIYQINTLLILLFQQLFTTHLVGCCIFSYNPLATWFQSPNRRLSSLLNPQRGGYKHRLAKNVLIGCQYCFNPQREGYKQTLLLLAFYCRGVSIPKGKATNYLVSSSCKHILEVSIPKGEATNA